MSSVEIYIWVEKKRVRSRFGPSPTLVDPVQWGPGPGLEKMSRTWPGPDLGQSRESRSRLRPSQRAKARFWAGPGGNITTSVRIQYWYFFLHFNPHLPVKVQALDRYRQARQFFCSTSVNRQCHTGPSNSQVARATPAGADMIISYHYATWTSVAFGLIGI